MDCFPDSQSRNECLQLSTRKQLQVRNWVKSKRLLQPGLCRPGSHVFPRITPGFQLQEPKWNVSLNRDVKVSTRRNLHESATDTNDTFSFISQNDFLVCA